MSVQTSTTKKELPQWMYKGLLLTAAAIWGLGFVVMKDAVGVLEPSYLIGFRFLATAVILAPFALNAMRAHHSRTDLINGAILGILLYLAFWVQTIGLTDTTPGKNAFLTGVYCVIVPFLAWVFTKRAPSRYNLIASILCIVGIGLVSLDGALSIQYGDLMTLVSAFFFALQMMAVALLSTKENVLALTVYQFVVGGVAGIVVGIPTESLPTLSHLGLDFWLNMAFLVIFASAAALFFMNLGLAHVSASQAALLMSTEAVFGVLFSVLLYGESLTVKLLLGFATIFAAIVVSEAFPLQSKTQEAKESALASYRTESSELVSTAPARYYD